MRAVLAIALLLCCAQSAIAAEAGPAITVLYAWGDDFGAQTAQHLAAEVSDLALMRTSSSALGAQQLLSRAREDGERGIAVGLGVSGHQVTIVRAKDGTVLSRVLDAGQRTTPYAVALVALELIDLAREPAAGGAAAQSEPGVGLGVGLGVALDAGLSLTLTPGHEAALAQPAVGVGVVLRSPSGVWLGLGVNARFLGASTLEVEALHIAYHRSDAGLRLSLGLSGERLEAAAGAQFGAALTETTASSAAGEPQGREQRLEPTAGLGLEGRLKLGAGFALKAALSLDFVLAPARFLVRDQVAFEEGGVRLGLMLGALWESW